MTKIKKGLTSKEREKIKENLRKKGIGWINGTYHKGNEKQEILLNELDCRSMIDSLIAYGDSTDVEGNRFLFRYCQELGVRKVKRLVKEQLNIDRKISYNVGVDSEGTTYNAFIE